MKILIGNEIKEINIEELQNVVKQYKTLVVDIGTGEGEFVYRLAKQNPDKMYIGIDTSADSMRKYSAKAAKKPEKGGLKNVMYVVCNADDLPEILESKVDKIFINLPWGSLRDGIIKGKHDLLEGIRRISKVNANLKIYISYCSIYEKQEIENRQLPELNLVYLNNELKSKYKSYDISIKNVSILGNEALKKIETKWAKKLGFGRERNIFYIDCQIEK